MGVLEWAVDDVVGVFVVGGGEVAREGKEGGVCGVKTRVLLKKKGGGRFEGVRIRKEMGYQNVIPQRYLGSARALESGVQVYVSTPVSLRTDILARCLRTRPEWFDKQVLISSCWRPPCDHIPTKTDSAPPFSASSLYDFSTPPFSASLSNMPRLIAIRVAAFPVGLIVGYDQRNLLG